MIARDPAGDSLRQCGSDLHPTSSSASSIAAARSWARSLSFVHLGVLCLGRSFSPSCPPPCVVSDLPQQIILSCCACSTRLRRAAHLVPRSSLHRIHAGTVLKSSVDTLHCESSVPKVRAHRRRSCMACSAACLLCRCPCQQQHCVGAADALVLLEAAFQLLSLIIFLFFSQSTTIVPAQQQQQQQGR